MNKLTLAYWLAWLADKYQQARRELANTPAYAILDIKSLGQQVIVDIKLQGTGNILSCSLREISSDEQFLQGFAIKDIRTLLYLDYQQKHKPAYQMVGHKIAYENNELIICFKHHDNGKREELAASELLKDNRCLTRFSVEDAYKIGYLYGSFRP